ncbi:MAG: SUMF1/EgtB/PvdO family nonheme iron enzyme [Planctomycetaceae bacterium]|nr:SUMF1/EgtB/PvdO family nonheme iron enzyme [Planctomycetaceae bacterium]
MSAELTPPSGSEIVPTEHTLLPPGTRAMGSSSDDPSIEVEPIDAMGVLGQPELGAVLFGRYLVEKKLGEGGMGTVWLVRHLELDAPRALKLIVSGIAFDPLARARFKREARVMARLAHAHAVAVHDARMAKDAAFIEMEYVRGKSLNKLLKPDVPMPHDWTTRILEQLCDVLQEAHALKIVHRDLKPANLMLVDGRPVGKEQLKVLDFGIAKILEGDMTSGDCRTKTGCFMGSAPWSSPEQASDTPIDGRSDLYSVGVILYEFLTGHRPFTGPITRVLYNHLYTPPPSFAKRNPNVFVPPEVERVVMRCLAKDPRDRPQSARELYEEFQAAVSGELFISPGVEIPDRLDHDVTPPPGTPRLGTPFGRATTEPAFGASGSPEAVVPSPLTEHEPASGGDHPDAAGTETAQESAVESRVLVSPLDQETDRKARRKSGPKVRMPPGRKWGMILALMLMFAVLGGAAVFFASAWRLSLRLPEGYHAENSGGLVNGWPCVLVRNRDDAHPEDTRFVRIEGGTFKMGNGFDPAGSSDADNDVPAHPVTLSDYYMQVTEVTNAEMLAYFKALQVAPEARPKRWRKAYDALEKAARDPSRYPAVGISHELAEQYARWVGGRLASEAQWEFAARSRGKDNIYVWGNNPRPSAVMANINFGGLVGEIPTVPVGERVKDKTEQGIVDLTGNVREWCRDVWDEYHESNEPLIDPQGPSPPAGRVPYVIRGCSYLSWNDQFRTTRPRRPEKGDPTERQLAEDGTADDLGFRVVIDGPPSSR